MSKITLTNVRLAFPAIFVPTRFDENSDEKYSATLLIPKDSKQVAEVNKAMKEVATAKWGAKADALLKSFQGNANKYCFMDGDLKSNYDGFEGCFYLTAKSPARPTVIDRNTSPLTADDGKPYAGCYVIAKVEIWAQDNKWGKGMRATLRGIQFSKDGDAFSGGQPASWEEFEDLTDGADIELT